MNHLRNVSWLANERVETARKFVRTEDSKFRFDPFDLNKPSGIKIREIVLCYTIDRYSELKPVKKTYVCKDPKIGFTIREILQHIYDFYNSPTDWKIMERIVHSDPQVESWDTANYYFEQNQSFELQEIMGDCMFFEGLVFLNSNEYEVVFGS